MERKWEVSRRAACILALAACGALLAPCYAEDPKPDPAGTVTGDKSDAADAGGTSFVVSAPTDKSDPDFARKQTEFEEFQAQMPSVQHLPAPESLGIRAGNSSPR